jgi:hypothetical protein
MDLNNFLKINKNQVVSDIDYALPNLNGDDYREIISELIKLDIPLLEVGSSSIGKSYSIREMLTASCIKGEFLFVGTEKSEFIEGIPNLKAITTREETAKKPSGADNGTQKEDVGEKFNYLKPYWFPNKTEIGNRLLNGRTQIENITGEPKKLWENIKNDDGKTFSSGILDTLKDELTKIYKSEDDIKVEKKKNIDEKKKTAFFSRYKYADAIFYLSMIQGYGNFWLILDEIDKVEEQDKDKYAPLLHIVRERELKGWSLSGIRQTPYDIKFTSTLTGRIENLNKGIDAFVETKGEIDLTDTRIIGIANNLTNLETSSPALYRRFVKIVIDKTLYLKSKEAITDKSDASEYQSTRDRFNTCIVAKEVKTKEGDIKTIADAMAFFDITDAGAKLDELNLQWSLGFFPELLFPGGDFTEAKKVNYNIVQNVFIKNFNDKNDVYAMYLYKILTDNFENKYVKPLLTCCSDLVGKKKVVEDTQKMYSQTDAEDYLRDFSDYNNPDRKQVAALFIKYIEYLELSEKDLKNTLKAQPNLKDKKTGATSTGTYDTLKRKVEVGGLMIKKTIKDNTPTTLTNMLMSGIPYIQQSFISHSIYVDSSLGEELKKDIQNNFKEILKDLGDKSMGQNVDQIDTALNKIKPDEEFVNLYGYGIDANDLVKINKLTPAESPEKKAIVDSIVKKNPVMIFDKLLLKLNEQDKIEYIKNTSDFLMAEKEILNNIPPILAGIRTLTEASEIRYTVDVNGRQVIALNDKDAAGELKELEYYCTTFPFATKEFILDNQIINTPEYKDLKENMIELFTKSIANKTYSKVDEINSSPTPATI